MGTAFSSSMFGLSGALILGFLDLTAGQAMNRFFNELEEWLAGLTRLSSGTLVGEGDGSVPVYVQSLLEQTAENMDSLQRLISRGEEGRASSNAALITMSERLSTLADTLQTNHHLMERLAANQVVLGTAVQKYSENRGGDDITRGHLRNMELLLQRLVTESEQGRMQSLAEVRSDIKLLTRTLASMADSARQ